MSPGNSGQVRALAFDMFGTTFDWWTGVRDQIADLCARSVVPVDAGEMTSRWREQFFAGLDRLAGVFDAGDQRDLVRAWHRLPAWADVAEGIERLRSRFTVCALSNGSFAQITSLIKNAGLHFDCVPGADISRHYKPDVEIYRSTIELLDAAPSELMMVAAHGWDLAGARAAG
jgi:2-haloacid dehalogenase